MRSSLQVIKFLKENKREVIEMIITVSCIVAFVFDSTIMYGISSF